MLIDINDDDLTDWLFVVMAWDTLTSWKIVGMALL